MTTMTSTGFFIALGTVLCWTISVQFFEVASKRIGPLPANIIRIATALFLFSTFLLLRDGTFYPQGFPLRAWILLAFSGAIGFFVGDIFLFKALVELGPRLAMLLHSLSAPAAAVIGWLFLGERYEAIQWLGIGITLGGVGLVLVERNSRSATRQLVSRTVTLPGILFGLLAMLGQAGGMVLSKAGMQHEGGYLDAFAATQIRALAAFFCFFLFFTVTRRWRSLPQAFKDSKAIGCTAAGAALGPFLGVALALLTLHYLDTGIATTVFSLVPVCIIPFAVFLHREHVSLRAIAGAVIAVAGVCLLSLF